MTTYMCCLYVGGDYTYTDINALAQGIKSFLASQVCFQAVAGAGTYLWHRFSHAMYVCMYLLYVCVYKCVCVYVCVYKCISVYVCMYVCICHETRRSVFSKHISPSPLWWDSILHSCLCAYRYSRDHEIYCW